MRPKLKINDIVLYWCNELPTSFTGRLLPGGKVYTATGNFGSFCVQFFHGKGYVFSYGVVNLTSALNITIEPVKKGMLIVSQLIGKNIVLYINSQKKKLQAMHCFMDADIPEINIHFALPGAYEFFTIWYDPQLYKDVLHFFPNAVSIDEQDIKVMNNSVSMMSNTSRELIERVIRCLYPAEMRPPYYKVQSGEILFQFLVDITRYEPEQAPYRESEARSIHAIALLITNDITIHYTIPELAKKAAMNEQRFKTVFKMIYGMGPFEYLREKRLERAIEMLDKGEMVKYAAIESGWRPQDLTNAYKARYGITPTQKNNGKRS
ncbi:MAG: helix-turn-helix transcriptional regulator [Terrimonas sp.]|nr:helix-turn-helix transcriptional regulator [Terrimonas sp.]